MESSVSARGLSSSVGGGVARGLSELSKLARGLAGFAAAGLCWEMAAEMASAGPGLAGTAGLLGTELPGEAVPGASALSGVLVLLRLNDFLKERMASAVAFAGAVAIVRRVLCELVLRTVAHFFCSYVHRTCPTTR